jgi:hypothetical protein
MVWSCAQGPFVTRSWHWNHLLPKHVAHTLAKPFYVRSDRMYWNDGNISHFNMNFIKELCSVGYRIVRRTYHAVSKEVLITASGWSKNILHLETQHAARSRELSEWKRLCVYVMHVEVKSTLHLWGMLIIRGTHMHESSMANKRYGKEIQTTWR